MNNIAVITQDIYDTRDAFAAVLTDPSINFEREASFAIQVLQGNEYSLKAAMSDRQAVINAVTNIAAIGSFNETTRLLSTCLAPNIYSEVKREIAATGDIIDAGSGNASALSSCARSGSGNPRRLRLVWLSAR